jgi:DNA helicase-2/ATP-dependent DNA helicase PcrA
MFIWTDRELNPEQTEAVLLPGSVFLMACPGSGKTRTLTYKIAYELSHLKSARRQFVVALTYTHRAADEILERIEALGVDTSQLWIGTIHSFCLEWIIKPYGIYVPELAHGYRIIDQHEREKLLERLCAPYKANRISHYDCDYYFAEDSYRLGCPTTSKHPIIRQVLAEYFRILTENRQIDFELILWYASKLIREKPIVGALLSKLFTTILVDEYQDTKQIQYGILASILRAGEGATRLFMVGDPNQAIYGSLGGYPIDIDELRGITGISIIERHLSQNYRSSSRIIDFFCNFNVNNTTISPAGVNRHYPSLVSYDNEVSREDLAHEIARLIRHHVETLGVLPSEICVLAPWWYHLAAMTRQLVIHMPDYDFDGPGTVPFARDIENFWYKLSRLALTEPSPTLYIRRRRWAEEVISNLREAGVDTSRLSRKMLLRECNATVIDEADGLTFLWSFFAELFQRLGVRIDDFAQLHEHHQAFFESSEARIRRLENEGVNDIRNIAYFKKVFQNRSGITVSTIHGVKGAEFDVVIAYALLDGMVPHFNDAGNDESAQKLLYVIGSRARKNLHLFSETGRRKGRDNLYEPTHRLAACIFDYDDMETIHIGGQNPVIECD